MIKRTSKDDWQYLITFSLLAIVFIATDVLRIINKFDFAYISGRLLLEPYRIISTHFIHADLRHLLANAFGIVVVRYFFMQLRLKSSSLFIVLLLLLIPIQSFLQWVLDIYLINNPLSMLIGFSGLLYGVDAFILLSSIYGKNNFLHFDIGLSRNLQVRNAMSVLTGLGFIFSLFPRVSLSGHFTGFLAGLILFLF
ncbi:MULTISPECIES: rhomboid family intramembrane serine protease [Prochlorococcus]|uniref:Membrane serine protease of rhomboid family n=1 Tax=Prochlorococcus marinus (strain SARG / CCMP1375 / SS120) TaxID=167539 RepID=Q7VB78_PROMA|nr:MULTISPECIES: rhomboid family intramembrane serine protease [Prochlorococcus]AAQ00265.1 Membrane serine protease of rhomboid family [Prochlorococcus marinus subsp. marinus str. CCMP1375]KGG14071.1 hypothetical protein EV04_0556 [Prochlorococcus marinus str. LG]KGG20760.1 hypothetical protein EV08_0964 [Prochlorococcus marinus str. SS2]KGG25161.1 hypothetical protein EV09_0055 [Prochlorococcus marinus str. SS35]KGG33287.1 hypothetical protein EV10_0494 [Prochlorococcus marinus str. SS51]